MTGRRQVGDEVATDYRTNNLLCRCNHELSFDKAPVAHSLQPVGDLLATKISGGRREVAGWLQGGRRLLADRLQKVAGTIWSQGGFGCCKWNLSATKSILERCMVVADRLPTGRRLVGDWSPTSCSGCRQSRHSFKSPTDRRPVADRLPTDLQKVAEFLQSKTNAQDSVANQSPTDRHSVVGA